MKKISCAVFTLVSILAVAQAPLEKGKLQLNGGFGFSSWGSPVYVGADYGIHNMITLGSELSYQTYSYLGIKSTIIGIQFNGNYHFNEILDIPSEWDFYAGLNASYYNWNVKDSNTNISFTEDEPFGISAQVGGRYFFNDKFGVNLEYGGGSVTNGGKIGITYKL